MTSVIVVISTPEYSHMIAHAFLVLTVPKAGKAD
jgi:hypothetical protein